MAVIWYFWLRFKVCVLLMKLLVIRLYLHIEIDGSKEERAQGIGLISRKYTSMMQYR